MTFFKKHGINLILALILCGFYILCFSIPYFSFWALYIIIPLSVYLMHRYNFVVGPILTAGFCVLSFFLNHSNIYLFFTPIILAGQLGLYFSLKSDKYRKGICLTAGTIILGILLSVFGTCIIAGERNFPSLLKKEIMQSENNVIIVSSAKSYFKSIFPTEEEEAKFLLPDGVEIKEGSDPKVIGYLYVYGMMVEREMNYQLPFYMFAYTMLLGGAAYLIGNLLIKKLLIPSYFLRPKYPVYKEIKTDETGLHDMQLPKGFFLYTIIPVMLLYLLSLVSDYIYPIFRAAYYGLTIVPFTLSGVCFALYLAKLIQNFAWQIVAVSAIIVIICLSVIFSNITVVFAVLGFADYFLNTRRLISKMFAN